MKPNAIFHKPLSGNDVRRAVIATLANGSAETINLMRQCKVGYSKAAKLHKLMYDAGIVVDSSFKGTIIILKDEAQATNAALRKFKKGAK